MSPKNVFFDHRAVENLDHHGHSELAKKGFWTTVSVKEGFPLLLYTSGLEMATKIIRLATKTSPAVAKLAT